MSKLRRLQLRLQTFLSQPLFNVAMGLVMVGSSLTEVLQPWLAGELTHDLGAEHGVVLFGLTHVLKSLPDLFEGAEDFGKAVRVTPGEDGH